MITRLYIRNLILIDQTSIQFGKGLNILTGETGSGKSALLSALSLILGGRSDFSWIRKGSDKAIVEAVFDIDACQGVSLLLQEKGILHEPGDELIVCREIHAKGGGRVFINNQRTSASLLKQIGKLLVEMVGQHANQQLFSLDYHRFVLDSFGYLGKMLVQFKLGFEEEREMQKELDTLKNSEAERIRELERCLVEEEELTEANVQEGEDELLYGEYTRLLHADEITKLCQEIYQGLDEEILPGLHSVKRNMDQLLSLDSQMEETTTSFQSTLVELQEVSYMIEKIRSQSDCDPHRIEEVNERLSKITRLKKKYGDLATYHQNLKVKIAQLENADSKIEELERKIEMIKLKNETLAKQLTKARKKEALLFQKQMTEEVRQLNMQDASFSVAITSVKRSNTGDDGVEFFLSPNVGERAISVKECASGGELSRVMLAIQTLLGGKDKIPTLIFDEIDANIGGETAHVIGEKLKGIAKEQQVFLVTHFPQVAKHADHHYRIRKEEVAGRTLTYVDVLEEGEREEEINRMLGFSHAL